MLWSRPVLLCRPESAKGARRTRITEVKAPDRHSLQCCADVTTTSIHHLRLSHFRSYHLVEIEAGGKSIAFFGPNGAGKTNVLEAASLLVPGRGIRRAAIGEMIRAPERIGWRVEAEISTGDRDGRSMSIITAAEGENATRRNVTIDDKPAPQTALGSFLQQVWLAPAMDRLWSEGPGDRRRFLDRLTLGFYPDHAEAALDYEKAMRARNRLLREGHGDDAWLGALEAQMARAGARIARARAAALSRLIAAQNSRSDAAGSLFPQARLAIIGAMEARFSQAIHDNAGSAELDEAEQDEEAWFARELAGGRARDRAAGRTLDGPHRSDLDAIYAEKDMPARACSTGEQKALLISLCLANARALVEAMGATPILLLDEVAAHLDADRRRALYGEIHALGAQALATGTSEQLFEGFNARRIAVRDRAGMSELEPA